jgi:Ca-activated chloride channel homolog
MTRCVPAERATLAALAAMAGVFAALLTAHAQQPPSFRAGVELVSLSVTATGPGRQYVADLSIDDFVVLEDGQPQDLVFFSRASANLAVSLLIDSSASMLHRLERAQDAARAFVERLRPGDVAQIIDFDSRVQLAQPFTDDREALFEAISSITAGGLTALYNAIYVALREFDTLPDLPFGDVRRHVIVVLSDGEDTSSLISFDALLDEAQRSPSVIFTIGLGLDREEPAPVFSVMRDDARFVLRRLATQTGGRLFLADEAKDLSAIYQEIADELTNQYVLGYVQPRRQGGDEWRRIAVRVSRPSVHARTRPGYYADATIRTVSR